MIQFSYNTDFSFLFILAKTFECDVYSLYKCFGVKKKWVNFFGQLLRAQMKIDYKTWIKQFYFVYKIVDLKMS